MPEPLPAFAKVEEALAAVLVAGAGEAEPLEGWTVLTDHPAGEAIEPVKTFVIFTRAAVPEQAAELGQTLWNQTLEIEAIDGPQVPGMVSRAVATALAKAHTLIAADRTLGGRLQDIQEIDIAGTQAEGRDVHGASVQYRAEFYTPRDDWFTILGQGGAEF